MSRYPQGQALLDACRAGLGTIVIAEGESTDDDPYFYGRWFGALGREISFYPQNGWKRVVEAVAALRAELPTRRVFGIRDRDFLDEAGMSAQASGIPADGVFRTPLFTLENYLLHAEGWSRVVRALHRTLPDGWSSAVEVQAQIDEAYRACLEVAAHNWTICDECARKPEAGLSYVDACVDPQKLRDRLSGWESGRGAPRPLADCFDEHLSRLRALSVTELPRWVTGKAVLKVLLERMPLPRGKRLDKDLMVNLYMDKFPDPPSDLEVLVRRILEQS